jgi:hypothetical protein
MQIFSPAQCKAHIEGVVFSVVPATIYSLDISAGGDPGRAVIGWPQKYAQQQFSRFGQRMYITLGGAIIFRGCIGSAPITVSPGEDMVQLVCLDDKWIMSRHVIGENGINLNDDTYGFTDVGYDIVFNRDGRPDMKVGGLDFSLGPNASFWTYRSILYFLFEYYVDKDVAIINTLSGSAYNKKSMNINLVGQTALQAIDTIVELAGESWGLRPTAQASEFVPVRPGGYGSKQQVKLAAPGSAQSVATATEKHAASITLDNNIQNCRDYVQVVSGNDLAERTLTSTGANPILVRDTAYKSKEYLCRYAVDVTKYESYNLGYNMTSGARPKPWMPDLVTRVKTDGSGFLTAAQIAATPTLEKNERAEIPVWVSLTGNIADAKLVNKGVRVNHKEATLELHSVLGVFSATAANKSEALDISASLATLGIWITCATVLETNDWSVSLEASKYLPKSFTQYIQKQDLVPENRQAVYLPNLTTGDMVLTVTTKEDYVSIQAQLDEIRNSVTLLAPHVENHLELLFDFIPTYNIGDLLEISGRNLGQSGKEVVISVHYDVHEDYRTTLEATDVMAGAGAGPGKAKRNLGAKPNFGAKPSFGPKTNFGPRTDFGPKTDFGDVGL